jgi:hypothetical protein
MIGAAQNPKIGVRVATGIDMTQDKSSSDSADKDAQLKSLTENYIGPILPEVSKTS